MNTKKILMYNGGTESYRGCSAPNMLVKGELYEVIGENDLGFQTNYSLNGINGEFNSVWFSEPTSYFAYTNTVPVKGKPIDSFIRFEGIHPKMIKRTSPVRYVVPFGTNLYKVFTKNTLYIVKVLKEES